MSLFGALQSGISGLGAQSNAMGAIADNITNVNTIGYKNNKVDFQTLVTKQASSSYYSPGGVQPVSKQGISAQGLLASNSSSTALAVSGNGFFVVNQAANPGEGDLWAYTRAGDFVKDENGYLKNNGGFYAQGWSLLPWDGNPSATKVQVGDITYMKAYYDTAGNTVYINDNIIDQRNLRPINLSTIGGTATATKQISFGANLPSSDPIYNPSNATAGGRRSVQSLIYDSLGNASNLSLNFTKTSSNGWNMSTSVPPGAANVSLTGNVGKDKVTYAASGQMEFNAIPENGSVITITQNGQNYTFEFVGAPGTAVTPGAIEVDTSGATSTSEFITLFANSLQNNVPDGGRFTAGTNGINITQSTSGLELTINASKCLACVQSAANPVQSTGLPSGIFTVAAVSDAIKNCGNLTFTDDDLTNYDNKTVVIDGKTFEFTTDGTVTAGNIAVNIGAGAVKPGESAGTTAARKLVEAINVAANGIVEPGRFTASGSTVEILPSSTGPNITIDADDLAGIAEGRIRTAGASEFINIVGGGAHTMSAEFNVLDTVEKGAQVPAVRFNDDGTPKYFYVTEMSIEWANGAQDMSGAAGEGTTIKLNMGNVGTNDGLTGLSGNFTTNYIKQDGAKFGSYSGVTVDENGVVTALFDNGETRPIAILPLATFSNPDGMEALTGNSWIATDYSGQALLKQAGTNGAGEITSNSLENSTVDLATEFSNMIVTQRAYSAATKIITTADEMLDELTRLT